MFKSLQNVNGLIRQAQLEDRAAANMIQTGLETGQVKEKVLIDATSGNTGIAYAMFGASLGLKVELALPQNASKERQLIFKKLWCYIAFNESLGGTDGAQRLWNLM